jgi:hypothetical protein
MLPPDAIHSAALREELHPEYLYLECIRFIHKVKIRGRCGQFHTAPACFVWGSTNEN